MQDTYKYDQFGCTLYASQHSLWWIISQSQQKMVVILKNIFRPTASKLVTNNVQIITKRSIKSVAFDVQIISAERVKSSFPTEKHLRTYKLSLIDQIYSDVYISLVFFYSANCNHQDFRKKKTWFVEAISPKNH